MPVILKIDPRRRIVCSTFHGEVTDDELLLHPSTIAADPDFSPEYADIVDLSELKIPKVSGQALSKLAGNKSLFRASVPHVIVAPTDVPFEMATHYQEMARESRPNLFVVRTLAEAYEVLRQRGYSD